MKYLLALRAYQRYGDELAWELALPEFDINFFYELFERPIDEKIEGCYPITKQRALQFADTFKVDVYWEFDRYDYFVELWNKGC